MDTQGPNPWSLQLLQVQLPKDPYSVNDTNDNTHSKNNDNNDCSFDSAATTPHTDYVTHTHPKNIFYGSTNEEDARGYSVEGHVRTWSYQDTLTSDHGENEGEDEAEPVTITSSIITSDQIPSFKEIVIADAPLENDMLEHLVQRLQSEVADTRAIVQDLESRLNAAENSNKHIVQELKVLLADAEGTLVGSDDSDSESSALVSSKPEEDSNIVYNRICHALQSLITEAQSALMRSSSLSPSMEKHHYRMNHRQHQISYPSEGTRSTSHLGLFVDDEHTYFDHCIPCPSLQRIDKTLLYPSPPSITSNSSSRSVYSTSSELSRILWKEKQQEQYDRYRRSCDMVSLELQLLLNDSAFDSDSDTSVLSSSSTKATNSGHPSTTTLRSMSLHQKKTKDGPGSKAERMQRRYQVQFLNPNVQRQRSDGSYKPRHRHYKHQGVGASRSQGILMQLYDLWKHTWLRNRFMHVLTTSVEVLVVLVVLLKVSQASLTWMGVRLDKSQSLLTYIYGHRHGGAAAKELYEKIRRDGLRFTQIRLRQLYPETEALLQDVLGDKPRTPFTPAGMVLGPAKRMLTHTVAGVALAFVSENARHIAMKL